MPAGGELSCFRKGIKLHLITFPLRNETLKGSGGRVINPITLKIQVKTHGDWRRNMITEKG